MNQKRDQARINIINLLLNASDYEQISIIRENQELIDSEFVNTMIEVAEVLAKQGKPKASLWLKNLAFQITANQGNLVTWIEQKVEANQLIEQGKQQYEKSKFELALKSWEQALSIYRAINNCNGEANALNNIALVFETLGNYSEAIKYYQQSLSLKQKVGDVAGRASSLNNLGAVYIEIGQLEKGMSFFKKALQINQSAGNEAREASSLGHLSRSYQLRGEYKEAIKLRTYATGTPRSPFNSNYVL